ncbi:HRQ family protein 3 [Scheffersomyces xylosifermentans]|uniref:HRQ family protein 3 n=1 Tax=Scheffersomyces xylosifermentans TaxID=1304137 RepID=UPI00315CE49B
MDALGAFLLFLGLVVSVVLSHKQIKSFVSSHASRFKKEKVVDAEKKSMYGSDEPLPKPTPLMITPEQVQNYDDRPWRPFRWPYHQTMSIFRLDINHWLDMDKYYVHYIEEKKRILNKYGKQNMDWLPESYDACYELMETVTEHLIQRYPLLFTVLKDGSFDEKTGKGKIIRNEVTNEVLDMTLPLKEYPLWYVTKLAKEDFYIVKKSPVDEKHYLVAAAVPFPGGSFDVHQKVGCNLDVIHSEVPYYKEKLQKSMERWFNRMKSNEPVERASWYISWDHKLKINNVYQIPKYVPNQEADLSSTDPKEFNVRVERQTLRRLPRSQAIIFTNHPIFYSIEEMKDEPLVPSLIKKIIFEAPKDIIKYKNFEVFRNHISDYLEGLVQRQIEKGIIDKDTPLKTLPSYPFAHWADTDFDYVNGWNNPSPAYDKSANYTEKAKQELTNEND